MSFSKNDSALLALCIVCITISVGAVGHLLTSVPAAQDRFATSVATDTYWSGRLDANLYLGSSGLFFIALITIMGTYLFASRDPSKQFTGRHILLATTLPHITSIVLLFTLTPSDWAHTITHILAIILISFALTRERPLST